MSELRRFYAEIEAWLFGEAEVGQVEARLGPSSSGAANLDFYRVLIGRNFNKILAGSFVSVHTLVTRDHPGLWPELVRGYAATRREAPHDPNRFGIGFSDYLAARRAERGEYSAVLEELADYHMCRYLAAVATDEGEDGEDDDGFERRVFVRGYTYPIPSIVEALARDDAAELPGPRPSTLIIYRSLHGPHPVRVHRPTAPQLGALARRGGLELPPALAELPDHALADGLARLVAAGVLRGAA